MMSYLKTLFPLEQLTLKLLTLKTVMLCALASAQRAQTLCALDLNCISYCENSVNFVVTERLKTSRPGGPTVNVSVPVISNEASICPKTCLTEYISRTSSLRGSNNQCTSKVFISYTKPYKPVAPATIARWLKSVLSSAGIDTNMFKAHSVRGAATSAAYDKGAPIEKILKLANWSNEKTFYKYYLRSSSSSNEETARIVLSDL